MSWKYRGLLKERGVNPRIEIPVQIALHNPNDKMIKMIYVKKKSPARSPFTVNNFGSQK
jgi:hypothetical protein